MPTIVRCLSAVLLALACHESHAQYQYLASAKGTEANQAISAAVTAKATWVNQSWDAPTNHQQLRDDVLADPNSTQKQKSDATAYCLCVDSLLVIMVQHQTNSGIDLDNANSHFTVGAANYASGAYQTSYNQYVAAIPEATDSAQKSGYVLDCRMLIDGFYDSLLDVPNNP